MGEGKATMERVLGRAQAGATLAPQRRQSDMTLKLIIRCPLCSSKTLHHHALNKCKIRRNLVQRGLIASVKPHTRQSCREILVPHRRCRKGEGSSARYPSRIPSSPHGRPSAPKCELSRREPAFFWLATRFDQPPSPGQETSAESLAFRGR